MPRRVQFLGIKLPLSHPVLGLIEHSLTLDERKALRAVENAGVGMLVIPGHSAFVIGTEQGFSKGYSFDHTNDYTEVMTDSDASILFRGGIIEHEAFRDLDYPPHRNKAANYPSLKLMSVMRIVDPSARKVYSVTPQQAKIVAGLFKRFSRAIVPEPTRVEAGSKGTPKLPNRRSA